MKQPAPVLAPAFGTRRLAETGRRPGVRGMTISVTALERKIEQILRDAASPCAVLDIQRKLRLVHGKVREDVVLSTLERGAVFVTPGEGRWWLKARLYELSDVAPAASRTREPAAVEDLPLLGALAKARRVRRWCFVAKFPHLTVTPGRVDHQGFHILGRLSS